MELILQLLANTNFEVFMEAIQRPHRMGDKCHCGVVEVALSYNSIINQCICMIGSRVVTCFWIEYIFFKWERFYFIIFTPKNSHSLELSSRAHSAFVYIDKYPGKASEIPAAGWATPICFHLNHWRMRMRRVRSSVRVSFVWHSNWNWFNIHICEPILIATSLWMGRKNSFYSTANLISLVQSKVNTKIARNIFFNFFRVECNSIITTK